MWKCDRWALSSLATPSIPLDPSVTLPKDLTLNIVTEISPPVDDVVALNSLRRALAKLEDTDQVKE